MLILSSAPLPELYVSVCSWWNGSRFIASVRCLQTRFTRSLFNSSHSVARSVILWFGGTGNGLHRLLVRGQVSKYLYFDEVVSDLILLSGSHFTINRCLPPEYNS